ncbi:MAG: type II toxin-antitoxin system prevent-host-death family antitoxin [Myxococcaceae bacterium]|nr:type II toxin-antitoxin system prevent-host-death family antitoxin [Myxococcaceae bacterium]MCI0668983.1 type II toxin-antitoxin system prevent-host-death family antitoxin [Myxococcaceae bacterium]
MTEVNIAEAKARLSELVNRALAGEEIVIARDHKPLVKLVTVASSRVAKRKPGSAAGQVEMAEDYGAPLDDFAGYR